jgi:hypothetical protein
VRRLPHRAALKANEAMRQCGDRSLRSPRGNKAVGTTRGGIRQECPCLFAEDRTILGGTSNLRPRPRH